MTIHLIPLTRRVSAAELEALFPAATEILACDFYVNAIEQLGSREPWGFSLGRVTNVDHHAPAEEMQRKVSVVGSSESQSPLGFRQRAMDDWEDPTRLGPTAEGGQTKILCALYNIMLCNGLWPIVSPPNYND
jgi:hypothetical protein